MMFGRKKKTIGEKANGVIKNHMIWSMGAGFIPVPFADLLGVGAVQLDMIRQLSDTYERDFKDMQGKAIITSLTGSSIARLGASAIKFIPGVGAMMGGAALAVFSAASTYALGEVFKKHFETGGTFLDFDPERLRDFYNQRFEEGKEIALDLKNEQDAKKNGGEEVVAEPGEASSDLTEEEVRPQGSILDQLKDLAALYKSKVITKKEMDVLKKKILADKD